MINTNTNNPVPFLPNTPHVPEARPAVIQIDPEAGASQENAHPHLTTVLQNRHSVWAKLTPMAQNISEKMAQLHAAAINALAIMKDNPTPQACMAAAVALYFLADHMLSGNHHVDHQDRRNLGATTVVIVGGGGAGAAGRTIPEGRADVEGMKKLAIISGGAVGGGLLLLAIMACCVWPNTISRITANVRSLTANVRSRARNTLWPSNTNPRHTANMELPGHTNAWGFPVQNNPLQDMNSDGTSLGAAVIDVPHDSLPTSSEIQLAEISTATLESLPLMRNHKSFESVVVDAVSEISVYGNGDISMEKVEEQLSNIQNPQEQDRAKGLWQKLKKAVKENPQHLDEANAVISTLTKGIASTSSS